MGIFLFGLTTDATNLKGGKKNKRKGGKKKRETTMNEQTE